MEKRFLLIYSEGPEMMVTSEGRVSHAIDMQDAFGDVDVFYLSDYGQLLPVTIGKEEDINTDQESPVRYSQAPMIVNKDLPSQEVVGYVVFTDH